MTDLLLAPDVTALVSQYLRSRSELTDMVGQRVYTVIPNNPTWPLVRLTQFDSIDYTVAWLDGAVVQVDAFGGGIDMASDIGRTARALLHEMYGTHDEGVVTGVRTSGWRYQPDATFDPAKPCYLFTAVIAAHPLPTIGS